MSLRRQLHEVFLRQQLKVLDRCQGHMKIVGKMPERDHQSSNKGEHYIISQFNAGVAQPISHPTVEFTLYSIEFDNHPSTIVPLLTPCHQLLED